MNTTLLLAIASVVVVSLISLVGVAAIWLKGQKTARVMLHLVSLSAGVLLGNAFLHLIPEATERGTPYLFESVLAGIIFFLIIEKIIHWRHCHVPLSKGHVHSFAYMNLVGDALHNLLDGVIIGAAYIADVRIGIATTIAVILHEIPQEMGDFAVLVHGGFSRNKALLVNFATAAISIIGVGLAYLLGSVAQNIELLLVPFAAGGFIYIASSDLIPQLHKNSCEPHSIYASITEAGIIVLGILLMYGFRFL